MSTEATGPWATPKMRKLAAKIAKRFPQRGQTAAIDHTINSRAQLAAAVLPHVRDGHIGIYRSGMDCDCVQYSRAHVVPFRGIVALDRAEDDRQQWLDGPESTSYCTPAEARDVIPTSRDLALEAFEDGHPHVVYAGSLGDNYD